MTLKAFQVRHSLSFQAIQHRPILLLVLVKLIGTNEDSLYFTMVCTTPPQNNWDTPCECLWPSHCTATDASFAVWVVKALGVVEQLVRYRACGVISVCFSAGHGAQSSGCNMLLLFVPTSQSHMGLIKRLQWKLFKLWKPLYSRPWSDITYPLAAILEVLFLGSCE